MTISAIGLRMPPPPMGTFEYYVFILLLPKLYVQVFIIGFVSTVVASLFPAYRTSRTEIVEALGHV